MSDWSATAHDESEKLPGLLVQGHRGAPCVVPFRHRSILLGRHPGCQVRLNHAEISMRHALALRFRAGIFLLDLESRSGTLWDGHARPGNWLTGRDSATIARFSIGIIGDFPDEPAPIDPTSGLQGDTDKIPVVELLFAEGSLKGTRYRIKRSITLIGRGPRCKVRLRDDADISQIHACLLLDEQGLLLIDTLSRRGTLVENQRERHAFLQEGQRIRIGDHLIEVARCRIESSDSTVQTMPGEDVIDSDFPERALVQSLQALREVPEEQRGEPVDKLLGAGTISPWQSRKIRKKDPTRLILDDRFLMMEPIERGGMSTVYRAFDLESNDTVALKMPETRVGDPERRFARFRREIEVSSRLNHPHIVSVRGTGRAQQFLVFDFVRGKPLNRLIGRDGALAPTLVARWISEVADALAYAHDQGVIHRDIKPENIMITETDTAMLMDLGLAGLLQEEAGDDENGLTRIGFTVGTLDFMSPEQAIANSEVDGRADIYSLGCTMYAALSGGPPFRSDNLADLARQHLEAEPLGIPDLNPDLGRILQRTMEKRPDHRYQTAGEVRDALQEWVAGVVAGIR